MLRQRSFQYMGWGTQGGIAQQEARLGHCREEGTDSQPSLRGDGFKHSCGLKEGLCIICYISEKHHFAGLTPSLEERTHLWAGGNLFRVAFNLTLFYLNILRALFF